MADPNNPNPRQKFVAWLDGRNPTSVEQLVEDLHAVSGTGFEALCQFASRLVERQNPTAALASARAAVEQHPPAQPGPQALGGNRG